MEYVIYLENCKRYSYANHCFLTGNCLTTYLFEVINYLVHAFYDTINLLLKMDPGNHVEMNEKLCQFTDKSLFLSESDFNLVSLVILMIHDQSCW